MKGNKGQTLYYFLIFTMILVISWAMMLNIAKLIRDRMIMQNKADNIALSISVHKARVMNFVGACNYLIGTLLAVGTIPDFTQMPTYTTNSVASYPFGDYKSNQICDDDVKKLQNAVKILQDAQEAALLSHLLYHDILMGKSFLGSDDYQLFILPTALPTVENAEKIFGLKRNTKGIKYLKTINLDTEIMPHIAYNPYPGNGLVDLIEKAINDKEKQADKTDKSDKVEIDKDSVIGTTKEALPPSDGFMQVQVSSESKYSWYVTTDEFSNQKTEVILRKKYNDRNKPLFSTKKVFDIQYPEITVFSASAIYNTKGKMFPENESDLIGHTDMDVILIAVYSFQCVEFLLQLAKVDVTPYKILTIAMGLYLTARPVYREVMLSEGDKNSPIKAYKDAKKGGWAAHLIPFKTTEDN